MRFLLTQGVKNRTTPQQNGFWHLLFVFVSRVRSSSKIFPVITLAEPVTYIEVKRKNKQKKFRLIARCLFPGFLKVLILEKGHPLNYFVSNCPSDPVTFKEVKKKEESFD